MKILPFFSVFILAGCAHENAAVQPVATPPRTTIGAPAKPDSAAIAAMATEQIRTGCIQGRRLICGKVLEIFPEGLVIDSGYTDLLRAPLTKSWVIPGNVSARRNPNVLELNEPETPCIGLIFLTDIPKKPPVKKFDYVVIMGYPAGQSVYAPAPGVKKTIRKFSTGADTAARRILQAEESSSQTNSPAVK